MSAKYSATIGLNVGDVTLDESVSVPLIRYLQIALSGFFGGSTLIRAEGSWIDDEHNLVIEPSILVYVLVDKDTEANYALFVSVVNEYRVLLNQQSVLIERYAPNRYAYQFIPE